MIQFLRTFIAVAMTGSLVGSVAWAEDITFIGDSQSASSLGLFAHLRSSIESQGTVRARAACGATIGDYLASSSVAAHCSYTGMTHLDYSSTQGGSPIKAGRGATSPIGQLSRHSKTVVVELGDNHLHSPASAGKAAALLAQKLLAEGKSCIWIGPASIKPTAECQAKRQRKRAVSEAIKRALAKTTVGGQHCQFIDSWSATDRRPTQGDRLCLHYTRYDAWANAIREPLLDAIRNGQASSPAGTGAVRTDSSAGHR